MKKLFSIFMACTTLFCLAACSNNGTAKMESIPVSDAQDSDLTKEPEKPEEQKGNTDGSEQGETEKDALVVYFSATGNTRTAAETLARIQSADLYEIVPEQPYTEEDLNYNNRSTRATVEQNDENARPAISGSMNPIDDYDVIYIGYPVWWGDMPRILYTFFDHYDLSQKTIVPFCTSGGSGISETVEKIKEMEPEAVVLEGLSIRDSSVSDVESNMTQWLSSIGLEQEE